MNLLLLGFPVLNFASRGVIYESRGGSLPRPATAGLFSEFKVSDHRMAELRLEVGTVFTARGDPTSLRQTRKKLKTPSYVGQAARSPGSET